MRALGALLVVAVAVSALIWDSGRRAGSPAAAAEVVRAERGDVAVTVGGLGHVNTLSGAATLAVPGAGSAGGGAASSGSSGSGSAAAGSGAGGGGGSLTSADAVFPTVTGHVARVLVKPGERVAAGQPVAVLADDGAIAGNVLQARGDLSTARLELAQKRVQDPLRGLPPTGSELASGRASVLAARTKLNRVLAPPLAADVATARQEVAKAVADLAAVAAGRPQAIAAGQLAVETARRKLATLTGAPDPAELTAAQLELAKATLDQETLLRPVDAPSASAIQPADLAPPTAAAQSAAQLAVDSARRKLEAVVQPPAATVSAAQRDVATAEAELAGLGATRGATGTAAARAAVTAARRKLARLRHPTSDVVAAARADVRRAQADLAVLRQRGEPARAIDLALARLKLQVGRERLALAADDVRRLTVPANASGIVTSVLTARGAAADPTTPVARVEDLDHLVVSLDLSEFDVGRIRVGAPVRVSADALGGQEFGGHVRDIASGGVASGGVVNFPVIITLNSHRRLRPGMSVSARVIVRRSRNVIRVPLAAVAHRAGRPSVSVRTASGALARRPVALGLSGAEFVEVRSGLRAGERVVLPSAASGW